MKKSIPIIRERESEAFILGNGRERELAFTPDIKRAHRISGDLKGSHGISRDLLRTHNTLTIFTILAMLTKIDAMII